MSAKLVPFYRVQYKNKEGYTLFLNKRDNRVYKSIHGKSNQLIYWLLFFLAIIVMRSIASVNIAIESTLFIISLLLVEAFIGSVIGIVIYKQYYKNVKEVFYTPAMIESYIKKGKKMLKIELGVAIGIFMFYIISVSLFLYDKWLIWNILSVFLISLLAITLCALPMGRFKLYKERNDS